MCVCVCVCTRESQVHAWVASDTVFVFSPGRNLKRQREDVLLDDREAQKRIIGDVRDSPIVTRPLSVSLREQVAPSDYHHPLITLS